MPEGLNTGLIIIGACGLVSFMATLSLLSFVAYRFCTWRDHYTTFIGYNQYVLLFLNLVSFYWIAKDAILAPTSACTAQGFLLHLGDVASAFFVLAIAIHTYWTAVMSRRVPYRVFGCILVIIWLGVIFLTVLGLAIHKDTYFVRAGSWCWISNDYEPERLGLHYFWLFLSEFGLIVLYVVTFIQLRSKTNSLFSDDRAAGVSVANQKSIDAVNRITTLMMLYPFVYVVLTLPLSAARMWSMARGGQSPSNVTNCVTGALLASCGWVDCLLYTLTRERLLANTMQKDSKKSGTGTGTGQSYSDQQSKNGTILQTTTWTVQNESFDLGREEGSTAQVEAYNDGVRDLSPGRSKSDSEGNVRDRSPSPTGSVDPIFAREQQQQQQSGVSRMLSATRRKDFAPNSEKLYELDTLQR
jgi:hypothetical protein